MYIMVLTIQYLHMDNGKCIHVHVSSYKEKPKSDFFLAKICKRFRFYIMTCAEVNVRVGEISDVVMRLRKKNITYNEKMHRVLTIALFT